MGKHRCLRALLMVTGVGVWLVPTPVSAAEGATCLGVAATIVGTPGDDTITGTEGPDVIEAGQGDDTILAPMARTRSAAAGATTS